MPDAMASRDQPGTGQPYSEAFYANQSGGSRRSAVETVPLILEWIPAASVVDVGCGVGTWLSVFQDHGVTDLLGLDGDYVDPAQLLIPSRRFRSADLTAPPAVGRTFDLAVSLEVAEHLPAAAADDFVTYLVSLAPVVLFSAAIPGQGGVNHVNEQWPEYWAERFRRHGFLAVDALRPRLWRNEKVQWWYAQNMLLFVQADHMERMPALRTMHERTDLDRLALVHPRAFAAARQETQELRRSQLPENMSLRRTLRLLPTLLRAAVKRRVG